MLIEVTDDTFAELVLANEKPVAVDFWAEWCPGCKPLGQNLADLAGEFAESIVLMKINADENPIMTRNYRVMSLPTVLFFRDGEVVGSTIGSKPKSSLREILNTHALASQS